MNSRVTFLRGVAAGAVSALALLAVGYAAAAVGTAGLSLPQGWALLQAGLDWTAQNLRGSVVPFGVTLVLYLQAVRALRRRLLRGDSPEAVAQAEHWVDLWTSLFFGIGVIWTAIGMRSALLAGLADLDPATAAEVGAFAILQRLVDGGILLALSTTIVGGIGGYLMRVYKGLSVGSLLRRHHASVVLSAEAAVLERLDRLDSRLRVLVEQDNARGAQPRANRAEPTGRITLEQEG